MFTKDSRTENFLTQMGVSFRYSNNVSWADMIDGWDSDNIARPVAVREDAVLEYAALMENGSAAPAPILHSGSRMKVLDGVQRLSAAKLNGSTKISAYIVDCDSEDVVAAIRVLANARLQGRAEPAEWTKRRAVEVLVVSRGLTVSEVSRMGGWRPSDIEKLASAIRWSSTIESIGGPDLPDNMIEIISKNAAESDIRSAPEPVAGFLHTLKQAKFSAADAEPYIVDFFKINSGAKQHKVLSQRLKKLHQDPEIQARVRGRKGVQMTGDVVLLRNMKSVVTVLDEIAASGEKLIYVDEYFKQLGMIEERLRSLANRPAPVKSRVPADMWSA